MKKLWVSSPMATGQVNIDDLNIIIDLPPIWRKFYGTHYIKLITWLNKKSGKSEIQVVELKKESLCPH